MSDTTTGQATFLDRLRAFVGRRAGPPFIARDPVNEPMIRHWCEAMGDRNPVYTDAVIAGSTAHGGIVAPPTMLQAWTMKGLVPPAPDPEDAQSQIMAMLDEAGFTSIVATNCEQEYVRYLRPGDVVTATTIIDSVSEEKSTALGPGHFFATLTTYTDGSGELAGTQRLRLLKFRPSIAVSHVEPPRRPHPTVNEDTAFFWDGARRGELLIQRCRACRDLRHPPRPMCPSCRSPEWDTVRASGRGTVFSYVVHHHPDVPGFQTPYVVALVELDEGTRLVSNLIAVDPAAVVIGMPVEVEFTSIDGNLTLPLFRPAS